MGNPTRFASICHSMAWRAPPRSSAPAHGCASGGRRGPRRHRREFGERRGSVRRAGAGQRSLVVKGRVLGMLAAVSAVPGAAWAGTHGRGCTVEPRHGRIGVAEPRPSRRPPGRWSFDGVVWSVCLPLPDGGRRPRSRRYGSRVPGPVDVTLSGRRGRRAVALRVDPGRAEEPSTPGSGVGPGPTAPRRRASREMKHGRSPARRTGRAAQVYMPPTRRSTPSKSTRPRRDVTFVRNPADAAELKPAGVAVPPYSAGTLIALGWGKSYIASPRPRRQLPAERSGPGFRPSVPPASPARTESASAGGGW